MANSILSSHAASTSNTILVSHGWPDGSSPNSVLGSHDADYPAAGDTTPDAFTFTDQTDVAVNTTRTSNSITVAGITAAANISITGGTYQIGAGSFVSTSGTVTNGQTVTVRHTSSASNSTATNTVLTIGGRSDTFTSTTVAASGTFAITGTSLTGTNLTISGAQFGAKSPAAPVYFQPFVGITTGVVARNAAVGMDFCTFSNTGGGVEPAVDNTTGIGGGSLRSIGQSIAAGTDDWKTHYGKYLSNVRELFVNTWLKLNVTSGSSGFQLKWVRAGMRASGGTETDPEVNYATSPRVMGSVMFNSSGTWPANNSGEAWLEYRESDGTPHANFELDHDSTVVPYGTPNHDGSTASFTPPPTTAFNQWWNNEAHYKANDYTTSNGYMTMRLNGKERIRVAGVNAFTGANDTMQYVILNPLTTGHTGANVDVYLSRTYIDSTRARVFLGNASTYENCTGYFLCPPTSWDTGSIIVSNVENVPTGYDWAYVVKSDGTVSNGWAWR